ncbi:hypothetical protein QYE76_053375 [Lolium multiflorum]|uniref:Retrotransposon gag domain-containing protein n=1 Tax=Lolium multiflorum TaxID=4521 RepID=A0AAD8WKD1_LOLMU|nr:hypothetical protein QYE76_053375 [Lolium multiflorum]
MFNKTEEPLDADDWLQTMENNLEVAGVEAAEKVLFATHYLSGPARAWWTSARAMNAGQMMNWEDFKLKFSKYHVPQGLIKKMRDEFRELKQGRMSVVEYRDREPLSLPLHRTTSCQPPLDQIDESMTLHMLTSSPLPSKPINHVSELAWTLLMLTLPALDQDDVDIDRATRAQTRPEDAHARQDAHGDIPGRDRTPPCPVASRLPSLSPCARRPTNLPHTAIDRR